MSEKTATGNILEESLPLFRLGRLLVFVVVVVVVGIALVELDLGGGDRGRFRVLWCHCIS